MSAWQAACHFKCDIRAWHAETTTGCYELFQISCKTVLANDQVKCLLQKRKTSVSQGWIIVMSCTEYFGAEARVGSDIFCQFGIGTRGLRPKAVGVWKCSYVHLPSTRWLSTALEKFYQGYEDRYRPAPPSFWDPHPICVACLCSNQNINKTATIVKLPTILLW